MHLLENHHIWRFTKVAGKLAKVLDKGQIFRTAAKVTPETVRTTLPVCPSPATATQTPTLVPPTATPVTPTATPTPSPYVYTVQEGDSISVIAARFGLSEQELRAANGITSDNIWVGQPLIIPVNIPSTLSPILADILRSERPVREEFQQAWGALNIFGNPNSPLYPNSWWLADGNLSLPDAINLVMQGEVASSQYGQQAVAARYIYYCGTTPDCNGNTAKLLEFLAYYHAWRESGQQIGNISTPPSQNITDTTTALTTGNTAYLQRIGLSGALSVGNQDMPFHFANVSPQWNDLLHTRLRRESNGANNFWVLTINELQQVCPSWGVSSPDMTAPDTSQCY